VTEGGDISALGRDDRFETATFIPDCRPGDCWKVSATPLAESVAGGRARRRGFFILIRQQVSDSMFLEVTQPSCARTCPSLGRHTTLKPQTFGNINQYIDYIKNSTYLEYDIVDEKEIFSKICNENAF
jgi:hypothetical protein